MARVAQRRSNPPYLIILFVFLFVIAAAVAALFYTSYSDQKEKLAQLEEDYRDIVLPNERTGQQMSDLRAEASDSKTAKSVLSLLIQQRNEMVRKISGTDVSVMEALSAAEAQIRSYPDAKGLVGLVRLLEQQRDTQAKRAENLKESISVLESEIQRQQQAMGEMQAEIDRQRTEATEQLVGKQAQVEALSESYDMQINEAVAQWRERVDQKDQELVAREDRLRSLQNELRERDDRIAQLISEIGKLKPGLPDLSNQPDGRVILSYPDQGVVYINIGKSDRVRIGLPFTVYSSRTGVTPDADGKAKIVVKNVESDIAECHVVQSEATDPILEGDFVANVAFNAMAAPVFVVAGDFDMGGDDALEGKQQVISMIKRYGGTVADDVDVNVDFVVLGDEPRVPNVGAASTPSVRAIAEDRAKLRDRYNRIKDLARDYQIPVLNLNRFLASVGYTVASAD